MVNALQNNMLQTLMPDLTKMGSDFKTGQSKLERYKLATDASLSDKLSYALYRIWNAAKAIFGQSDWQCVQKAMVKSAQDGFKDLFNAIPFANLFLKDEMPLINQTIEKAVIAGNFLYIDSKLPSIKQDKAKQKAAEKIGTAQIEKIFDRIVNQVESAGVALKSHANKVRYDGKDLLDATDLSQDEVKDLSQTVFIDEGVYKALQRSVIADPRVIPALLALPFGQIIKDTVKEFLTDAEKNDLLEAPTKEAIQNVFDSAIRIGDNIAKQPLVQLGLQQVPGMIAGGQLAGPAQQGFAQMMGQMGLGQMKMPGSP